MCWNKIKLKSGIQIAFQALVAASQQHWQCKYMTFVSSWNVTLRSTTLGTCITVTLRSHTSHFSLLWWHRIRYWTPFIFSIFWVIVFVLLKLYIYINLVSQSEYYFVEQIFTSIYSFSRSFLSLCLWLYLESFSFCLWFSLSIDILVKSNLFLFAIIIE